MTTDEPVLVQLAEANPVPDTASPTAQQRAEAERILRRVLHDAPAPRRPRLRLGLLVPVASVLVVVVVAAVVLRTGSTSTSGTSPSGGLNITLSALPTPRTPRVTTAAMSREIALLRRRLASVGPGFIVTRSQANRIVVTGPKAAAAGDRRRIVRLITQPAQLRFYDWEADVLTPNGRSAASQLLAQDHIAVSVSQGTGGGAGFPGAGSVPLYDAVTVAARQPVQLDRRVVSRTGPEYYMFGSPGSAACAAAARLSGLARPVPGTHCLLAGPIDLGASVSRQRAIDALAAQLPPGVTATEGEVRAVPQGTVVIQAEQPRSAASPPVFSPAAQFFVLRDDVVLTGAGITNPRPSIDQSGATAVTFGFTGTGRAAFQRTTKAIAHRGADVSLNGLTLDQHFAVVLDNQLLTVPSIGFHQYPDGITGATGADIVGGFSAKSAKDLATELRYGALPLDLRVVR
jgi:SecD/SecF fusion protein